MKKTGKHAQGTICYTVSPLHTVAAFVDMAQQLQEMKCDSICIKDMAGLLKPQPAYDLVKGIKERCGKDLLVHVHTHATTGVTLVSLMKAIEAGCDIVDTAVSSLSLGPGHNPTESLVELLEGTGYETRLDLERVLRVSSHFASIRPRYREFFSEFTGVDTEIFKSQIPGGMISNMESQLKGQGAGDRLQEVLLEVPNVRKDAGYPPLVTPSSQIVGSQAVFNVLMGKYKVMTVGMMVASAGRCTPANMPRTILAVAIAAPVLPAVKNPAGCAFAHHAQPNPHGGVALGPDRLRGFVAHADPLRGVNDVDLRLLTRPARAVQRMLQSGTRSPRGQPGAHAHQSGGTPEWPREPLARGLFGTHSI